MDSGELASHCLFAAPANLCCKNRACSVHGSSESQYNMLSSTTNGEFYLDCCVADVNTSWVGPAPSHGHTIYQYHNHCPHSMMPSLRLRADHQ
jgi:hypothetical protein